MKGEGLRDWRVKYITATKNMSKGTESFQETETLS